MRGRWRRWQGSIRGRLLSGFVLLFVLGLGASTLVTAVLADRYLQDRAVDTLVVTSDRIEELVRSGPQTVQGDQFETLLGAPQGAVGLDSNGQVLFATGAADDGAAEVVRLVRNAPPGDVVRTEDDLLAKRIDTPDLEVVLSGAALVEVDGLVVVVDANVDDDDYVELFTRIAGLTLLALAVLVVLAVGVLRIGLRPLTRMAGAADAIARGSRDERIPLSGNQSETDVLAAALNRAFDAQARAESRARAFAADASHELRTPIATVSGWLELYRQGGLQGEGVDTALGRIEEEIGRIRLLVEELGLLARLDTGRPLEQEPVDLARLLANVVEDARVIYADLDIELDLPGEDPRSTTVTGDAARLQQVVNNLLGNAVQHTPSGTAVRVSLVLGRDDAQIVVADDGPGISAEDQPRLFDRFWRAETSRSRDYGGSGLGLSIVQAIVRAHDGRVDVSSQPGRGTAFVIHLPRTPSDPGHTRS